MTHKKKLIEVALPLEAINKAAAREKSIRHGHPSTLHLWWARRPLAAARAVIFAQMVDDPSAHPDLFKTEREQKKERGRLFKIIEDLVQWENTTNEEVLQKARDAIWESWRRACAENADHPRARELFNREVLPAFHDPFAGGGALPLEAQRLGLESYASDLNPVAVLINKAMIEIPPRFAGKPPVHPPPQPSPAGGGSGPLCPAGGSGPLSPAGERSGPLPPAGERSGPLPPAGGGGEGGSLFAREWKGAQGLAEDVRYYGQWMRDEAEKRIGHLYPKIEVTAEMAKERPDLKQYVGQKLTVIAWLWARTVKSPNPAFANVDVPLASTFMLSTKAGKEAYVEPILLSPLPQGEGRGEGGVGYRFTVKVGKPKDVEAAKNGTKLSRGANFACLMSGAPISGDYIKAEGKAGRMGARLMAIVAEGTRGRVYLAPTPEHEAAAPKARPDWRPESSLPDDPRNFWTVQYGLTTYGDLFTDRQLVALTTFSDLVAEAREKIRRDALAVWKSSAPPPQPSPAGGGSVDSSPQRGEAGRGEVGREAGRGEAGRGEHWQPTPVPAALLQAAKDLRKNMTDAEQLLWRCLRGKQLDGFKFRKQHPIERFVLDFYCPAARLAIELDGGQHNTDDGQQRDAERSAWLAQHGIRVLRFWNHEVFADLDAVLTTIWDTLHDSPHPNPPPLGEGATYLPPEGGGWEGGDLPLAQGGSGATAYAEAVGVYLAFAQSKACNRNTSLCLWEQRMDRLVATFGRQALPMVWDFAETNPLAGAGGDLFGTVVSVCEVIEKQFNHDGRGSVAQANAVDQSISSGKLISTDPPYYDNIGYADLSNFFYVWLRRTMRPVFPDLFATMAVPKAEELVATPYRHGSKEKAETFFLNGMTQAMHRLAEQAHPAFPVTIYYAFKQSESDGGQGTTNTGWDTFLAAVIEAGFGISGTWPVRTEQPKGLRSFEQNALASSIVLVCRPRIPPPNLPPPGGGEFTPSPSGGGLGWGHTTATRRDFLNALKTELPAALAYLQAGNIAPVDLAQAAIGPGMAVYTRYAKVLDAEGKPLTVRAALALINQVLDEALAEQEGDFDADTRWALAWFEQMGFEEGEYGVAEQLSKAKNTAVSGLVEAGIAVSGKGKVRLVKPAELPADWDPTTDTRLTVWEMVHHLVRVLEAGGESAAAALVAKLGSQAEIARELCYRLYTLCERKKRAAEAMAYNALVQSWPEIMRLAREAPRAVASGTNDLFDQE
ncbi:MAG: DUF559 domain-containing protein [Candidatus Competibacteraceae bacterium]